MIDAMEYQKAVMCDIPGVFMEANIDEVLHMWLERLLAKLLTKVDPDLYTKYLRKEKGKDMMYLHLTKAPYGTLQAALLLWKDLRGYLILEGFKLNPYDNCVANKIVNGAQSTVLWYIKNLKLLDQRDSAQLPWHDS
jgi:hypothetical protein